ncbi:MAG: general secretion pathway protein GspB [Candidatus Omnitrophota bacterium]
MFKKILNFLAIFFLAVLIFFGKVCFAENASEKEPASSLLKGRIVKYTGAEAKRDPFMLSQELERLIKLPPKQLIPKDVQIILPKIELQGIVYKKGRPQAILNGCVINVGEYIEEFEVREITRNGIVLFYKGKEFEIKMQGY